MFGWRNITCCPFINYIPPNISYSFEPYVVPPIWVRGVISSKVTSLFETNFILLLRKTVARFEVAKIRNNFLKAMLVTFLQQIVEIITLNSLRTQHFVSSSTLCFRTPTSKQLYFVYA